MILRLLSLSVSIVVLLCYGTGVSPIQALVMTDNAERAKTVAVQTFGARCDGIADDTSSIQQAIQAAVTANIPLELPAGICIISPSSSKYIFQISSNLHIRGQGAGSSMLKIRDRAGDFTAIFGPYGGTFNNLSFKDFTIDYNSTNNPPRSLTLPRMVIGSSSASNDMRWDHVTINDINSINVLYSGSRYTEISNCRFELSKASRLYHDHSTLYIAAEFSTIGSNTFIGGVNIPGAATAIETHGGRQMVVGNIIDGYMTGMNITGIAAGDSEGTIVSTNIIENAYYGIDVWSSKYRSHIAGYGVSGMTITANVIRLTQVQWTVGAVTGKAVLGNASGIMINPTSDLPLKSIMITNNTVEYDQEISASEAVDGASSMGIGYWDATDSNQAFRVKISGNLIVNSPTSGIRWAAGGGDVEISDNTILNPGSSANRALIPSYRAGIMLSPAHTLTYAIIAHNSIESDHTGIAYGMEILGNSCVVADGNTVSVSGAAKSKYLQYLDTGSSTCATSAHGTQVAPAVQGSMLPRTGVSAGSTVYDASEGLLWQYKDAKWSIKP